jgi:hypothetical protein
VSKETELPDIGKMLPSPEENNEVKEKASPKKNKKAVVAKTKTRSSVTVKDNLSGEEEIVKEKEDVIKEEFFKEKPVTVWVDYAHTINLGNYCSAKVSNGLSSPVGKKFEEKDVKLIMEKFGEISKILEKNMAEDLAEVVKYVSEKNRPNK